ncbi:MAG TPA: hypothetical protein QF641_03835 [Candidatus Thalassarchaeaceae archaeon]|jgi:hypothetical protein|nr:hypothetical protein [Candidatus Thalassarchaeaceae archaeon]|tara:strand:+ start:7538 stop:7990 length:453 start_codon:yes stop_codon:yes gene_type:complete
MDEETDIEEGLPGPPPDPSKIPSVVRAVGSLDIDESSKEHGISQATEPDIRELREFLDEIEDMEPLDNNLSGDPMSEAWLQILLTLVVREHGQSSMTVGMIETLLEDKINKDSTDLAIFLDRLWIMGRLEKVYGVSEVSYSPNPSWLEMK